MNGARVLRSSLVLAALALASPALAQSVLMDRGVRAGELWCFPLTTDSLTYVYLPATVRLANDEQGQVLVYIDPKNLAGATKESLAGDPEALAISASYFESEADMLAHMPPALKILQPPYRAFWVNRDGTIYRWAWKGL